MDTKSYTPLMSAVSAGHVVAFNTLLKRGSSIDDVDQDGKTVVHLAMVENSVGVLEVRITNFFTESLSTR